MYYGNITRYLQKKVGIFVKEVEIFSLDEENYLYD
mgnify:FL=1